jgi:hypothetical protein
MEILLPPNPWYASLSLVKSDAWIELEEKNNTIL